MMEKNKKQIKIQALTFEEFKSGIEEGNKERPINFFGYIFVPQDDYYVCLIDKNSQIKFTKDNVLVLENETKLFIWDKIEFAKSFVREGSEIKKSLIIKP